jgi:hypothetical protein
MTDPFARYGLSPVLRKRAEDAYVSPQSDAPIDLTEWAVAGVLDAVVRDAARVAASLTDRATRGRGRKANVEYLLDLFVFAARDDAEALGPSNEGRDVRAALRAVAAGTAPPVDVADELSGFARYFHKGVLAFPRPAPRGGEPYAAHIGARGARDALVEVAPTLRRVWAELRVLAAFDTVPALKRALTTLPPWSRARTGLYDLVEAVCAWPGHPEAARWARRLLNVPRARAAAPNWRDDLRWAEVCLQAHAAWIPFAVKPEAEFDPQKHTLARAREAIARCTSYVRQADLFRGEPEARWLGGFDDEGLPRTPLLFAECVTAERAPRVPVPLRIAWSAPLAEHVADPALAFTDWELAEVGLGPPSRVEVKRSVLRVEDDADGVRIVCQLALYSDYVATHAAYGAAPPWHPKVLAMNDDFVDEGGRLRDVDGKRKLENHFGVSSAIVSSDGEIVHLRQSSGAHVSRDLVVPASSGGCAVDVEHDPGPPEPVRVARPDAPRLADRYDFAESVGAGVEISTTRDAERETWEEVTNSATEATPGDTRGRRNVLRKLLPLTVVRDTLRAGKVEILYLGYTNIPTKKVKPSEESELLRERGKVVANIVKQRREGFLVAPAAPTRLGPAGEILVPGRLATLKALLRAHRRSGRAPPTDPDSKLLDEWRNGRGVPTRVSHFTHATLFAYEIHATKLADK